MTQQFLHEIEIDAIPANFAFEPGLGWVYTIRDIAELKPEMRDRVMAAKAVGGGLTVKLKTAGGPVPPGQSLSIRGPDGTLFSGVGSMSTPDPIMAQAALQSARPSTAAETVAILSHRAGSSIQVHSRTLRRFGPGEGGGPGGDTTRPLIDDLNLIADPFIPATPGPVRTAISNSARLARGFVMDNAASYRIGELCITAADMIADGQEFARLPYPVVWVEMDQSSVLAGMKAAGGAVLDHTEYPPDDRIGFLYTGHGVYSASRVIGDNGNSGIGWTPFAVRMGRPMSAHQRDRWERFIGGGDETIDRFLWGNAYDGLDRTRRKALRHYSGIDILLPDGVLTAKEKHPLAPLLQGGGAGDWKLALAALLVLIRPGNVEHGQTRMPQRKLTGKGTRKLIGLTTVTINISARKVKSNIKRGVEDARRGSTRWHEVRGHYIHNRKARTADCIHDWTEVEPDRWICQHCGGKRAWRTYPNGRGSISEGVIAKHYKVTSKG
jgi:hypothetical protein